MISNQSETKEDDRVPSGADSASSAGSTGSASSANSADTCDNSGTNSAAGGTGSANSADGGYFEGGAGSADGAGGTGSADCSDSSEQPDVCVIMSAGEIRDYDFIRQFIPEGVPVFAADAGLYHLEKMNIEPSVVVGDFDSLIPGKEIHFPCVSFPPEKDDTDTILAVDLGLERGYRNFILLGASGGRLDHTFSNLSTLIYLREKGANGILIDNMNAAFLMCGGESYAPSEDDFLRQFGEIISVFTFGTETALVSEAGVKYPLERYSLSCAFPLGVSNKITDMEKCRISVHEGKILIIRVKNDTFSDISE